MNLKLDRSAPRHAGRMHLPWIGVAVLLLASLVSVFAAPDKKKPAPPPPVARLAWLAGNWRAEVNGRVVDEQWMIPGGGVMLGMVRTVVRGRLGEHEFRQIGAGPGGALYYTARATGQTETLFQATTLSETEVVFANPQVEFPRTISYSLKSDGTLLAVREGVEPDGQAKRIEVTYQRFQP